MRDQLLEAMNGYNAECAAVKDSPDQAIARLLDAEIGGFIRLTGGGWPPEHRQEFLEQCLIEFADVPLSVVEPAIREARRRVYDPKRFVVWVFERIAKPLDRLENEGKTLSRLAELAGI